MMMRKLAESVEKLNMDKLKNVVDDARREVQARMGTETDRKLDEALSNRNWGLSSTQLNELAQMSFNYSDYMVLMKKVWESLELSSRQWRVIYKALTILEHLVKNGNEKVIEDIRDRIYKIRSLQDFSYNEDGVEKGSGVREKAKQLAALLNDNDRIRDERAKARELREKFVGIGSGGGSFGSYSGGSGYGGSGFGSSSSFERSNSSRYDDSGHGGGYNRNKSSDSRYGDDYDDDRKLRSKVYDEDEDEEYSGAEEVAPRSSKKRSQKKSKSKKKLVSEDEEEESEEERLQEKPTKVEEPSLLDADAFFGDALPSTSQAPSFDAFGISSSSAAFNNDNSFTDFFGAPTTSATFSQSGAHDASNAFLSPPPTTAAPASGVNLNTGNVLGQVMGFHSHQLPQGQGTMGTPGGVPGTATASKQSFIAQQQFPSTGNVANLNVTSSSAQYFQPSLMGSQPQYHSGESGSNLAGPFLSPHNPNVNSTAGLSSNSMLGLTPLAPLPVTIPSSAPKEAWPPGASVGAPNQNAQQSQVGGSGGSYPSSAPKDAWSAGAGLVDLSTLSTQAKTGTTQPPARPMQTNSFQGLDGLGTTSNAFGSTGSRTLSMPSTANTNPSNTGATGLTRPGAYGPNQFTAMGNAPSNLGSTGSLGGRNIAVMQPMGAGTGFGTATAFQPTFPTSSTSATAPAPAPGGMGGFSNLTSGSALMTGNVAFPSSTGPPMGNTGFSAFPGPMNSGTMPANFGSQGSSTQSRPFASQQPFGQQQPPPPQGGWPAF